MWKSCSRCGKLHKLGYRCNAGREWKSHYGGKEAKLRNTNDWHKKAEEIKERSKYLCANCLEKGIYNYKDLEVHHIQKLREAPERLLDDDNLICLCRSCHKLADAGQIDREYLEKLVRGREG